MWIVCEFDSKFSDLVSGIFREKMDFRASGYQKSTSFHNPLCKTTNSLVDNLAYPKFDEPFDCTEQRQNHHGLCDTES